jgi:uncharacterized protein
MVINAGPALPRQPTTQPITQPTTQQIPRPTVRSMSFHYPEGMDPRWNRAKPEFSAVANAASLLMPYLEPIVVKTAQEARHALGAGSNDLAPSKSDLIGRLDGYIGQEARHHVEHRRFNQIVAKRYGLRLIDRWMHRTASWLQGRSLAFRLSWSAGFETVAFVTARWVDKRATHLFADVDELPAALFLWHLAEEVEHRDIADDVVAAFGVKTRQRVAGIICALMILGWFTVIGSIRQMIVDRRILNPVAWARLIGWGLSYCFEALPMVAMTVGRRSFTSQLAAPEWLLAWLAGQDPSGGTIAPFALRMVSNSGLPASGLSPVDGWPQAS